MRVEPKTVKPRKSCGNDTQTHGAKDIPKMDYRPWKTYRALLHTLPLTARDGRRSNLVEPCGGPRRVVRREGHMVPGAGVQAAQHYSVLGARILSPFLRLSWMGRHQ